MDKPRNKDTPTMVMFLKLAVCVYCKVERPTATTRAHMKHKIAAAKDSGIEARIAPTFPVTHKSINQHILISYM